MTLWHLFLSVLVIGAVSGFLYVAFGLFQIWRFVQGIKKANAHHQQMQVLAQQRLNAYPKIEVSGQGHDLLDFTTHGLSLSLAIKDEVMAWCREEGITVHLIRDDGNHEGPRESWRPMASYFSFDDEVGGAAFKMRWL